MTKEEIKAYQDGAYDCLKKLPDQIRKNDFKTPQEVIDHIERIIKAMDKMSTRKLGTE